MHKAILKKLTEILGERQVLAEPSVMPDYACDELSIKLSGKYIPEAVVKPHNTEQVAQVLALANKEGIAVTARGGATGLCGGCVPVKSGIVLSLERMNKVLEIDRANRIAIVEAGLALSDFYKAIEHEGLFFPPHPGDEGARIGGIIATNAGGARAVKYGIVRDYVRGIEAVLADGNIIEIGGKFVKNSSGYNLLNLFVGSEGTLGIITKATIALMHPPAETATLLVPFSELRGAIDAAPAILEAGILPMAVEFMGNDIVDLAGKKLQYKLPCRESAAYLLITLDAHSQHELDEVCHKAADICLKNGADDVFIADARAKQKELLDFRSKFYDVLKPDMAEDLDLSVPVSKIAELVKFSHKLQDKYGIGLITYGHAADGNVHVHVMKSQKEKACPERNRRVKSQKLEDLKKELYHKTKELGGMLSGEHGIGLIKVDELSEFVGEKQVELMRKIKKAFDPKGILNPGKIFK